jgi:hypothetical protein
MSDEEITLLIDRELRDKTLVGNGAVSSNS